jgi:hypothetical protein
MEAVHSDEMRDGCPDSSIMEIIEYDRKSREYREKLTLLYNPFETIWVFCAGLFDWCTKGLRFILLHPAFIFLFLPLSACWFVLEQYPDWEITRAVDQVILTALRVNA